MNTNFSSPKFKSNSNFYTLGWNNHSNFSWQAQVIGNYALQFDKLQNPEYSQFDNQASHPSNTQAIAGLKELIGLKNIQLSINLTQ
jgi:hypothetical protein